MKKILGIVVLGLLFCNTSFSASIKMECARHSIFFVDIEMGTLTHDLYYLKKKGSTKLEKKPNRTVYPIEEYSRDTIITDYADYKHGWVKQANKLILNLQNKTYSGHGFKASVKTMNKYDYWEEYSDPSLNIRYDYNFKCSGLKLLNVKNNNNSSDNNTNLSLDVIRETCRSFGYKEGTEKFADCAKALFLKR